MHDPTMSATTPPAPPGACATASAATPRSASAGRSRNCSKAPCFTGAIGRAFDAREKAAQAQEVALGALNLPSAADIERLTRRIRSLSQRLESIEDGVERLDTARLAERRPPAELEARLDRVEEQLDGLLGKLDLLLDARPAGARPGAPPATPPRAREAESGGHAEAAAKPKAARANRKPPPRKGAAKPKAARQARSGAATRESRRRRRERRRRKAAGAARKQRGRREPSARASPASAAHGGAAHRFGARPAAGRRRSAHGRRASSKVSETASTHPTAIPARGAEGEQRRGLHLDRQRPVAGALAGRAS